MFPALERSLFLFGYVCGVAEKVMLGACMVGIMPEKFLCEEVIEAAAKVYELSVALVIDEYWIYRPMNVIEVAAAAVALRTTTKDSPKWHRIRAGLCGIPDDEVDEKYHERIVS